MIKFVLVVDDFGIKYLKKEDFDEDGEVVITTADASRALGRSKNACLSRASRLGLRFTAPAGRRKG